MIEKTHKLSSEHMKKIILLFALFFIGSAAFGQDLNKFYEEVDQFLKKYTSNGSVSYNKISNSLPEVTRLYNNIGNIDLSKATDNQKQAFYINAYNMVVIYQVAKYFPLKSPMDQSGFFDKVKHKIAGEMITLNALEIIKLLRVYKEPKFHFALACAARGCPKLANFAYFPDNIGQQLDQRTRLSINDDYFIRVNHQKKTVDLSMIFKWYNKDFTMNGQTVLAFVNKYRKNKIPDSYRVDHYEYDWSLNTM